MPTTVVNVSGNFTHYRKPELCDVSIRIQHESEDQALSVKTVRDASNELHEYLTSIAPKDSTAPNSEGGATTVRSDQIHAWSMSSINTQSWIPYVHWDERKGEKKPETNRKYRATARFSITYKEWGLLSKMVLEISQRENFLVDHLRWRLTQATQAGLAKTVRAGSLEDAIQKALDYLVPLYPSETEDSIKSRLVCISINAGARGSDFESAHIAPMPKARMMSAFGASGSDQEGLNFEPEDVTLNDSISCQFQFSP